jgi:hypothetical protein
MVSDATRTDVIGVIRSEVAKYVDHDFSNQDDFLSEMNLASDDLSAIALTLEKYFQLKVERGRYRDVQNIDDYVEVIAEAMVVKAGEAR